MAMLLSFFFSAEHAEALFKPLRVNSEYRLKNVGELLGKPTACGS